MEKKVFLIGDTNSFMVNAIVTGLGREGYETKKVSPELNEISRTESGTRIWLLYLDGNVNEIQNTLVYLKDEIVEKDLFFFLVGNPEEISDAKKILPENLVTKVLERPLNVPLLAAELNKAVDEGRKQEAKKRILIIDDDPAMTRTIKNLLSGQYTVFMANSGMNGITFLAKNEVDLILLDYEMPVVSGAQVLEMIRSEEATKRIPVMFLTAKSDRESVMKVLALKPEKYLLKTMAPEEWLQNINDFFKESKREHSF